MLDVSLISNAEVSDLEANPTKYGLPTKEQFMKNPERYRMKMTADELMAQIDTGSNTLSGMVQKYEWYVEGYQCKSLEAAERVMQSMGHTVLNCKLIPEVIPEGAGKCKIKVTFKIPEE